MPEALKHSHGVARGILDHDLVEHALASTCPSDHNARTLGRGPDGRQPRSAWAPQVPDSFNSECSQRKSPRPWPLGATRTPKAVAGQSTPRTYAREAIAQARTVMWGSRKSLGLALRAASNGIERAADTHWPERGALPLFSPARKKRIASAGPVRPRMVISTGSRSGSARAAGLLIGVAHGGPGRPLPPGRARAGPPSSSAKAGASSAGRPHHGKTTPLSIPGCGPALAKRGGPGGC